MIKSILLATDGSYHSWVAWKYAVGIAQAYGAWLRVLSVVDTRALCYQTASEIGGYPAMMEVAPAAQLEAIMEEEQTQLLEDVRRKTERDGIRVETTLALGTPAETICACDSFADLVTIGHYSDRSKLDRMIAGSVADTVVRKSTRPVLVAVGRAQEIMRILTGYDGSEAARRALQWAADIATTLELPLDVVHVNQSDRLGKMVIGEADEYLKPYPLREVRLIVREGDVVEQMLATTDEQDADLVVMGAHGHSRLHEAVLGSVTEGMMQKTQVPLLMTR